MQFFKKNYEKVLLGLVLFGLVAAVGFLPFLVVNEKKKLDELQSNYRNRPSKAIAPLDAGPAENLLKRFDSPPNWDFSRGNKLFNPVTWRKPAGGGPPVPAESEINRLQITKIAPLYFRVTLDSATTNEFGARYAIGMEHEAAPQPSQRRKKTYFASADDRKKEAFTLRDIKGAPENPDLILELAGSGEPISVSKDKPYAVREGFTADLKYDPERLVKTDLRMGSVITFAGGQYKIVDIKQNEVLLSDQSNEKKYPIKYNAAP